MNTTTTKKPTNEKPVSIPLPFEEVVGDLLSVKPPKKEKPDEKNPSKKK